jgi:uncharacterized protein DUF4902
MTIATMPNASEDGYIRLSFEQFCALRFEVRESIVDEDLRDDLQAEQVPAIHAGFCEWTDTSTRSRICVGWAWFRAAEDGPIIMAPGGISTNVMLTANSTDLGMTRSNELMRAWLANIPWQHDIALPHQVPTARRRSLMH